ncbi:MAG TPA: DUF2807 domain-containing protein [Oligoflexus sp.]|uniref:GIN domain-containing protein n=1 Tax=Oligoflexus sp. TaxID=1971216 RepID=UPI002D70F508|nr:DUF2807 domain-containing protein [Oligoflexus sp.]HYX39125.1 DUF2807 domain-containing protein [Oligoflexus sp.]
MKIIALVAAFSFSYSSASSKPTPGSGVIKEEIRNHKDFKAISLAQSFTAKLSPGPFQVRMKGDDNILPFIETEVSKGVLRVRYKDGVAFRTETPIELFIQAPVIDSIHLSGASSLTGNLAANDELEIDTSGGSTLALGKVQVKNLDIDSSGASKVSLEQFDGKSLTIDSSGGCLVTLDKLNVKKLTVDASGASNINLEGTSEKVDIDVSGGTTVRANRLKAEEVAIEASGASDTQLKGAMAIAGDLTGGSTVHAAKSARVDINSSRAARVIQD